MEGGAESERVSWPLRIVHPASSSFAVIAERCSGTTCWSVTLPPVIAPAMRNVPASMRSGIVTTSAGWSASTPCISSRFVPEPSIRAPMAFRNPARAMISGSIAAFSIRVVPSARDAAIMTFPVAPTLDTSK